MSIIISILLRHQGFGIFYNIDTNLILDIVAIRNYSVHKKRKMRNVVKLYSSLTFFIFLQLRISIINLPSDTFLINCVSLLQRYNYALPR